MRFIAGFMSLFVDAYDWVMVPNVYAMSQHAGRWVNHNKTIFLRSAYLKKMGYNQTNEWCEVWDGLYWSWIWHNKDQLRTNPRWTMMCALADKMDKRKLQNHLDRADRFCINSI